MSDSFDIASLQLQFDSCSSWIFKEDIQYAACILGPLNNLVNNDCFDMTRYYSKNSFFNKDPGICRKFVRQFETCPLNVDSVQGLQCERFFKRVIVDSIPLSPFFSPSTWAMWVFIFSLIIILALISYLAFRNFTAARQLQALLKKNWALWRYNWIRNMFGYAVPLILLFVLYFVIDRFTSGNIVSNINVSIPLKFEFYQTTQILAITVETVSENRFKMYQNLRTVIGLFFLVIFMYPLSNTVSDLVLEKQSRMKETLKLTGVPYTIMLISEIFTRMLMFIPLALSTAVFAKYGNIFATQDLGYLFFFFLAYLVAMLGVCFGVSVFFFQTKPAIIAFITLTIGMYMQTYRVLGGALGDQQSSIISIPVGLGIGLQTMVHEASFGLGIPINFDRFLRETKPTVVELNAISFMFVMDFLLYFIIAIYLDFVVPQTYGSRLPWNFFLTKSFWFPATAEDQKVLKRAKSSMETVKKFEGLNGSSVFTEKSIFDTEADSFLFEPPTEDEQKRLVSNKCVKIRNLTRSFKIKGDKTDRLAVNNLNAEFYKGQVTSLLGSNGAGKSTTFSLLTGMMEPSSGDATIFGLSLKRDLAKLRKFIGFCPQHNAFYETLTVRQNLLLFGELKQAARSTLNAEIETLCRNLNIFDKLDYVSKFLSGGQKRKLSIAIALIGDSRFVIFDEPTAGMDPLSRRQTWNVIKEKKKGRIILLTTHFLDEADFLSDRIVIMNSGRAYCAGTPLFLKNQLSHGYQLAFSHENPAMVTDLVMQMIPTAIKSDDIQRYITKIYLPVNMTKSFGNLLDSLETMQPPPTELMLSPPQLEDVFLNVANSCHGSFNKKSTENLAALFGARTLSPDKQLHNSRANLLLNVDNLQLPKSSLSRSSSNRSNLGSGQDTPVGQQNIEMGKLSPRSPKREPSADYVMQPINKPTRSNWRHFNALLYKRFIIAKNDIKLWVLLLILPILFFSVPMLVPEIKVLQIISGSDPFISDFGYESVCMATLESRGNDVETVLESLRPLEFDDVPPPIVDLTCCDPRFYGDKNNRKNITSLSKCLDAGVPQCINYYLYYSEEDCLEKKFSFCKYVPWICKAVTCCDVRSPYSPFFPCRKNRALWAERNMRLGNLRCPSSLMAYIQVMITSFIYTIPIFIGCVFVPIMAAGHSVWEQEEQHNCKFQQISCGVRPYIYWLSTYAFDLGTMGIIFGIAVLFFGMYQVGMGMSYLGSSPHVMLLGLTLILFFSISVLPFGYLLSFFFVEHSKIITFTALFHLGSGVALGIIAYILRVTNIKISDSILTSTTLVNDYLKYGLLMFPGYSLVDGIIGLQTTVADDCVLARNPICDTLGTHFESRLTARVSLNLVYMFVIGLVSFLSVLVIESWKSIMVKRVKPANMDISATSDNDDVQAEKERLLKDKDETSNSKPILIKGLSQQFGAKRALRDLWLGIDAGECFGYLGVNGSGKTTTMKILTGKELPVAGSAKLAGVSIFRNSSRDILGYCPQFDALFDYMSVHDHLVVYSRIAGLYSEMFIQRWMNKMNLGDFRNVPAINLSGGNKRKLSFSIAMLGGPKVSFLDEPSTGLDAYSKRFLWRQIRKTIDETSCAVILTTHSIEECEALCPRIGILVDGELQCLGLVPYIKRRYGSTLTLELYFKPSASKDLYVQFRESLQKVVLEGTNSDKQTVRSDLQITLTNSNEASDNVKLANSENAQTAKAIQAVALMEECDHRFVYHIDKTKVKQSHLFRWMEAERDNFQIDYYVIGNTGLEDIFNEFAGHQKSLQQ